MTTIDQLFELAGNYNFSISFEEDSRIITASTTTAFSVLLEDLNKMKEVLGAEEAELYTVIDTDETFFIQFKMPRYECAECGEEYRNEETFKEHYKECRNIEEALKDSGGSE